ncbi:NUDIX hydrolase [Olivibacter sitiensis]|uniref:NUDIX hydrolase n=1 Tax=Olivibacter sitiensis TaxID=376470 RepID=UPI000429EFA0|nr:NUDIX domain-containing protein [Olivibacter sitiensis]
MTSYKTEPPVLLAVDCIIFGFDGEGLKILLIKRGFEPERHKWSLMGGFVQPTESPEDSAARILKKLTGLTDVYMEQIAVFGKPDRDTEQRVVSVVYFALIDINKYEHVISHDYRAEWFPLKEVPQLIFDHNEMVEVAKKKLKYKAALYPIVFELLPEKFTIPQIALLYESVYDIDLDRRNFSRKLLSSGLIIKLKEKDTENSKKGAFYFKINTEVYKEKIMSFLRFLPGWPID